MARDTWVQSKVESYQRLKKWYLIPPCLTHSIIRYGSRVKWSNPGKGVETSLTPWCSSNRKGSLRVTLDYGRQLYFLLGRVLLYSHKHFNHNRDTNTFPNAKHSTKHRRLRCSGTNGLLITWLRFFDTRRETQFLKVFRNHTIVNNTPNVRHISWSFKSQFISGGREPKNSTVCLNGRNPDYSTPWQRTQFSVPMAATQLSAGMVQCQPSTDVIFKILKFSAHLYLVLSIGQVKLNSVGWDGIVLTFKLCTYAKKEWLEMELFLYA